jgi:hypothetical protein
VEDIMNSSETKNAPKKSKQDVADLAPKKEEKINGGFVMRVSKASPTL